MCRCNGFHHNHAVGERHASLVTNHTKNGTLQPVQCAAETDSAAVAALIKRPFVGKLSHGRWTIATDYIASLSLVK